MLFGTGFVGLVARTTLLSRRRHVYAQFPQLQV
jgi:hypothetical protein